MPRVGALGFPAHDVGLTIEQGVAQVMRSVPGSDMPRSQDGRPDLRYGAMLFFDVLARRTAADLVSVLDGVAPDAVVYEQYEYGAAIAAHAPGYPGHLPFAVPAHERRRARRPGGRTPRASLGRARRADDGLRPVHRRPLPRHLPRGAAAAVVPGRPGARAHAPRALRRARVQRSPDGWAPATGRSSTSRWARWSPPTRCWRRQSRGWVGSTPTSFSRSGRPTVPSRGRFPANVHVASFVDQAALIPVADLVVHHGGSGTVLAALARGTPQVLLPKGAGPVPQCRPRGRGRPGAGARAAAGHARHGRRRRHRDTRRASPRAGRRSAPRSQRCPTRPTSSNRCSRRWRRQRYGVGLIRPAPAVRTAPRQPHRGHARRCRPRRRWPGSGTRPHPAPAPRRWLSRGRAWRRSEARTRRSTRTRSHGCGPSACTSTHTHHAPSRCQHSQSGDSRPRGLTSDRTSFARPRRRATSARTSTAESRHRSSWPSSKW